MKERGKEIRKEVADGRDSGIEMSEDGKGLSGKEATQPCPGSTKLKGVNLRRIQDELKESRIKKKNERRVFVGSCGYLARCACYCELVVRK